MNAQKEPKDPEEQFRNGRISIREYLEFCVKNNRELLAKDIARIDERIDAVERASGLQDEIFKERLEQHNQFRQQIEKERTELVRKDDLERVETMVEMRFVNAQERNEASSTRQVEILTSIEKRLSNMEGRWFATTVGGGLLISAVGIAMTMLIFLHG